MKGIEGIIRPHKMDEVQESLRGAGVLGISITKRSGHYFESVPKVKLGAVCQQIISQKSISSIVKSANTKDSRRGMTFASMIRDLISVEMEVAGGVAS